MTKCTATVEVGKIGRRRIVSSPDGGSLVSDGGATLLGLADRSLGLTRRVAACLPDHRAPGKVAHSLLSLVRQRVFAIAMGYEDLNDHEKIRDDAMLQMLLGGAPSDSSLASASTLCRFENTRHDARLLDLQRVLIDAFIDSFGRRGPVQPIVLDIDATADPTHGSQERNHFQRYYDTHCFLPLFVFCGEHLLLSWLRPSTRGAAHNARAAISVIVKRIRARWPKARIIVRGDSDDSKPRLMAWCEANDVAFVLGYQQNPKIVRMVQPALARARRRSVKSGDPTREYTSFLDRSKSWPHLRRIVAKAEWLHDKATPRFVVTTLKGRSKEICEKIYCARGDMENRIKEQQYGLFSDRTSCHAFRANQMRLALSAVAYVLMTHIRRIGLRDTRMERAQAWTIRERIFKVAARIEVSSRRIRLKLSESWPYSADLAHALRAMLKQMRAPPDWRLT